MNAPANGASTAAVSEYSRRQSLRVVEPGHTLEEIADPESRNDNFNRVAKSKPETNCEGCSENVKEPNHRIGCGNEYRPESARDCQQYYKHDRVGRP